MRDSISLERCKKLHPKIRQEAIDIITAVEAGFPPTIKIRVAQGLRTIAEQNELYAIGRTKPGTIVTKARGGKSYHNFGLSIDFCLCYDKNADGIFDEVSWDTAKDFDKDGIIDWQEVVKSFESKGWEWGGKWRTFTDMPHVQKTFNQKTAQLLQKINSGQIDSEGYVIL